MKLFRLITPIFLFTAGIVLFSGCVKQKFDVPPINIPSVSFKSNFTIASLKAMYNPAQAMLKINGDTIIKGIVTANDESGNIYKKIYIQDSTGGLEVELNRSNLSTEYKVGQFVYIKCKGLYLGDYNGITELGYPDTTGIKIGRIPDALIDLHLFRDSLPGKSPEPITLNLTSKSNLDKYLCMLVRFDKVRFPDKGNPFFAGGTSSATNRDVADSNGNVIKVNGNNFVVRTSSYANFAADLLPAGKGSIVGILGVFNGQYQLFLRDRNDVFDFDTTGVPPSLGTIYEQDFNSSPSDWIVYSIASNKDWSWDGSYKVMVANGYQGDVPSEDWLISPALDLTSVSQPVLSFKMWTKFTDSGLSNPFEVFISTNYSGSGNPSSATWTSLACTIPAQGSASWTSSGDIDLSAYHQKVYIGYRYRSSGIGSSTASKWEVDTFKLTGYSKKK
ncbi:MAG: DUF5689 domain-containing protein [Bacteroidota bacterium]|nr:DUF5689 domain-containing protein [Bacteroidota bacterium]